MKSKAGTKSLLSRVGFYLPFTWYFLLFAVAGFLGYKWVESKASVPDSSFKDIFVLLLSIALWIGLIIVLLGLLTVCFSYFYFRIKSGRKKTEIRIETLTGDEDKYLQPVSINIHPVLKPLLGFIRLRINYDKSRYSEKFSLVAPGNTNLFNTTLQGVYNWSLPEIREYKVEKVLIYFEDFFQFFSFAFAVDVNADFHTKPKTDRINTINSFPRKTEETTTRIDELRRVEGELINYKNFESNDDVRRIVWKIYAKNKELVVRIPEIMDPYASHIYLYPSFFTSFDISGNEVAQVHFLNFYKNICWSVFKQLSLKGLEVRIVTDQEIPPRNFASPDDQVKFALTVSNWQNSRELKEFIKPREASVVIVSSLSNARQITELADTYGNDISFLMVPLSRSFESAHIGDWLQWLFVQQEKDKTAVYKTSWNLSALKNRLIDNEKEISRILKNYKKSAILEKTI